MNRISVLLAAFIVSIIFLFSCSTPEVATKPVSIEPTPQFKGEPKAAWEVEWEKTLKAAQKEGTLSISSTAGGTLRTALVENFSKKYGINIDILMGKGSEVAAKLTSEQRAGLYSTDVYIGGSTTILTRLKPAGMVVPLNPSFILPELKDTEIIKKNWWNGDIRWLDDDKTLLAMSTFLTASIGINTKQVSPGEIKGWADLLNPKWKGRIVMNNPTQPGNGGLQFGIVGSKLLGWDYWRQMVKQQPVIVVDQRLMTDWLAQGRYAILIAPLPEIMQEFMQAGATIDYVNPIEGNGLTTGSGALAQLNKAPHPNAAKIFVNWILTKEGQTVWVKAYGAPSSRIDVTTEGLNSALLPKPGQKYIATDNEVFSLEQPEHFKFASEILESLLK